MENAADALKMAGAVLLFVLAISIIILAFGQVRESADTIIDYRDRETAYIDGNFYYEPTGLVRQVNQETIIPAIYRAYLEGYKIVFGKRFEPLYNIKGEDGNWIEQKTLGTESFLGNVNDKAIFIKAILYRNFDSNEDEFLKKFSNKINLQGCDSLKTQLDGKNNIIEYIGIYYEDDNPNVPELTKTKKRVITYEVKE